MPWTLATVQAVAVLLGALEGIPVVEVLKALAGIVAAAFAYAGGVYQARRQQRKDESDTEVARDSLVAEERRYLSESEASFREDILEELRLARAENDGLRGRIRKLEDRMDEILLINHRLRIEDASQRAKIRWLKFEVARAEAGRAELDRLVTELEDELGREVPRPAPEVDLDILGSDGASPPDTYPPEGDETETS